MGNKIYCFGECLIRIDVAPDKATKLFPTGTGLNFAANVARLEENQPVLLTALSRAKDSELISKFCLAQEISLQTESFTNPIGSYMLFRTPSQYGWEVVYNRSNTVWTRWMENFDVKALFTRIEKETHIHLDGITVCSSPHGSKNILEVIKKGKQKGCTISFDFNFRSLLGEYKEFANAYQQVIKSVDFLFISWSDLKRFVSESEQKEQEKAIAKFHKANPNLKIVCVSDKSATGDLLEYSVYCSYEGALKQAQVKPFKPNELLGMGDALAAFVVNECVSNRTIDLQKALEWASLKALYQGDAEGPTKKEAEATTKRIGVIR